MGSEPPQMPARDHPTVPRFHFFHCWTRWSAPVTISYRMPRLHASGDAAYVVFTRDEQTRSCVVCGAEQVREVTFAERHAS